MKYIVTCRYKDKDILVDIPAGIEDGQTLWLRIERDQEALVQVQVEDRHGLRRKGNDVHSDLEVSLIDAALGNVVEVQGLRSNLKVKLPEKTNSHTVLKLSQQGFKIPKSSDFGHHFVHVKISSWLNKNESNEEHATN